MSHTFCGTSADQNECKWDSWNDKAIYINTSVDDSVTHEQAVGEAVSRWNQAVGARFLMVPGKGDVTITFHENKGNEEPFASNENTADGKKILGLCFRTTDPISHKLTAARIVINSDAPWKNYEEWVHGFAHEIGHAFGLADHPHDNINSVMSYSLQGTALLGPSFSDVQVIAGVYGLSDLKVRPEDLVGIDNVTKILTLDRYGSGEWKFWTPFGGDIDHMEPYEVYYVRGKTQRNLEFGRFKRIVLGGGVETRWMYM